MTILEPFCFEPFGPFFLLTFEKTRTKNVHFLFRTSFAIPNPQPFFSNSWTSSESSTKTTSSSTRIAVITVTLELETTQNTVSSKLNFPPWFFTKSKILGVKINLQQKRWATTCAFDFSTFLNHFRSDLLATSCGSRLTGTGILPFKFLYYLFNWLILYCTFCLYPNFLVWYFFQLLPSSKKPIFSQYMHYCNNCI